MPTDWTSHTSFWDAISSTEETDYDVIRTKEVTLRPTHVDEAILQMNMLGHSFFVFLNAESGTVNVVYRRNDGGYGLIVPDR